MQRYSPTFEEALREVLRVEGDYSDHPADPGGETRFGITEARARAHGYEGEMRSMPASLAKEIYYENYWAELQLDQISEWAPVVAKELFDTGVNMGVGQVTEFLQRSLNVLNRQGQDWENIAVDGVMGPRTVGALRQCFDRRGVQGLLVVTRMVNALQGARYIDLAEQDSALQSFIYGWFRHRVFSWQSTFNETIAS